MHVTLSPNTKLKVLPKAVSRLRSIIYAEQYVRPLNQMKSFVKKRGASHRSMSPEQKKGGKVIQKEIIELQKDIRKA